MRSGLYRHLLSWIQELVLPQYRYTVLSAGHAIGSQLSGAPTPAISLWLIPKNRMDRRACALSHAHVTLAALVVYQFSFRRERIPQTIQ